MSFDSTFPSSPVRSIGSPILDFNAPGFPPAQHETEPDIFVRQASMPGHKQDRVSAAHVVVVGCGGLGSWIAPALARAGVARLTLIDHDFFDRTNAPRQLMFAGDIGEPKAHALAHNSVPHMTNAGTITGICLSFEDAIDHVSPQPDMLVVGVDNNGTRAAASRWGLERQVPVLFAMLSLDGLRAQVFLQVTEGACLRCVVPNADLGMHAPCAAASSASCELAAAHAVHMAIAALCQFDVPTWRETSLDGTTERVASPPQRADCSTCQVFASRRTVDTGSKAGTFSQRRK